jgi:hypothetical protein
MKKRPGDLRRPGLRLGGRRWQLLTSGPDYAMRQTRMPSTPPSTRSTQANVYLRVW